MELKQIIGKKITGVGISDFSVYLEINFCERLELPKATISLPPDFIGATVKAYNLLPHKQLTLKTDKGTITLDYTEQ